MKILGRKDALDETTLFVQKCEIDVSVLLRRRLVIFLLSRFVSTCFHFFFFFNFNDAKQSFSHNTNIRESSAYILKTAIPFRKDIYRNRPRAASGEFLYLSTRKRISPSLSRFNHFQWARELSAFISLGSAKRDPEDSDRNLATRIIILTTDIRVSSEEITVNTLLNQILSCERDRVLNQC